MDASWLLLVSVFAAALIPLWTEGWRKLLIRGRSPTIMRVAAIVILSLVTLLTLQIGPCILMAYHYGTLQGLPTGTEIPLAIAILFGPSIVFQTGYAIYEAIWGT